MRQAGAPPRHAARLRAFPPVLCHVARVNVKGVLLLLVVIVVLVGATGGESSAAAVGNAVGEAVRLVGVAWDAAVNSGDQTG